jgi:signal transduction histidine kinase
MLTIAEIDARLAVADITQRTGLLIQKSICYIEMTNHPEAHPGLLDKATQCANEALELSRAQANRRDEGFAYRCLRSIYASREQPDIALEYSKQEQAAFLEADDERLYSDSLFEEALLHYYKIEYGKALECDLRALEITERIGYRFGTGCLLAHIGMVEMQTGHTINAIDRYHAALEYFPEDKDSFPASNILNGLGIALALQQRYSEAASAMEKAFRMRERLGDFRGQAQSLNNLGRITADGGNLALGAQHITRAIEMFNRFHDIRSIMDARRTLSEIHMKLGNLDRAGELLEQNRCDLEPFLGSDTEMQYYESLHEYQRLRGDFQSALVSYKSSILLRNQLIGKDNERRIAEMREQFDAEKREREIEISRIRFEELSAHNEKVHQQNAQLEEMNRQLQENIEAKNRLFSIIAHDIRNPLSTIRATSEFLAHFGDRQDRAETSRLHTSLLQGVERLSGLVEDLLLWSKSQRGMLTSNRVKIYLPSIIANACALWMPNARAKHISLTSEIGWEAVIGDNDQLSTILRNLIGNALKFTPENGAVVVRTERRGDNVLIAVDDSGVGMTEEAIARLFHIDTHRSTKGTAGESGTGLGLMICRDLIQLNGGEIHIDSAPGEGSTFSFLLPVAE